MVNRIAFELAELPKLEGPLADYKPVTVSFVRLGQRDDGPLAPYRLDYASKLDRDPDFIDALMAEGIAAAHRAAVAGELIRPHACMNEVCAFSYPNPAWPAPAALAGLLDDAGLARQWQSLAMA